MEKRIKNYNVRNESFDETDRTIISYISTSAPDRYKDIVNPKGAKLDNYKKNPTVLFNHNYDNVIGKNLWIKNSDEGLVAKTQFAKTPLATDIMNLYKDGFLNAFSIGFIPEKYNMNNNGGLDIDEWELLEYSAVAVPANPEALALSYKSVKSAELKELFEKQLANLETENIIKELQKTKDIFEIELQTLKVNYDELSEKYEDVLKLVAETNNELEILKKELFKTKNTEDINKKIDTILFKKLNELLGK